jgi:hypothetical protein
MSTEQAREESLRQAGAHVLARIGALAGTGPLTKIGAIHTQLKQQARSSLPLGEADGPERQQD